MSIYREVVAQHLQKGVTQPNFKVFSLPLNFGPVEASLDLYYNEPPLLAANAFCLEHSEAVVKTETSVALCTETVVSMLMKVLNGVENSNFFFSNNKQ